MACGDPVVQSGCFDGRRFDWNVTFSCERFPRQAKWASGLGRGSFSRSLAGPGSNLVRTFSKRFFRNNWPSLGHPGQSQTTYNSLLFFIFWRLWGCCCCHWRWWWWWLCRWWWVVAAIDCRAFRKSVTSFASVEPAEGSRAGHEAKGLISVWLTAICDAGVFGEHRNAKAEEAKQC